jgi:fatty acid desaturase
MQSEVFPMTQERKPMSVVRETLKVNWYRCPILPEKLRELTKRSDLQGAFQTFGFLVLVVGLGVVSWLCYARGLWGLMAAALFCFGTVNSFTPGLATHELSHGTVWKTKWPNAFFLRVYSLLGWYHFHEYKRSHTYHHVYTLHPEGDREVVLPATPSLHPLRLLMYFTVNVENFFNAVRWTAKLAFSGKFWREWSESVFADDKPARAQARRWAWILLVFHAAVLAVAIVFRLWLLIPLVTLGPFIANWWMYFVGMPMHTGLRDNVPDFRLCVRSITLDPFSSFIYWHMNYHTEHHMYAAVPCYRLPRLAKTIEADMPKPRSVVEAWVEMRRIYKRQKKEPGYQFDTPLPPSARKANLPQDALAASIGDLAPRGLA